MLSFDPHPDYKYHTYRCSVKDGELWGTEIIYRKHAEIKIER